MNYNQLHLKSKSNKKRVGRGISAGQGKTAGRGTKGQKSRTGSSRKPGFEGGQNPLIQRLPKLRGFKSHRPEVEIIYTQQLNNLGSANINNQSLYKSGLISTPYIKVKLLTKGKLNKKVSVSLQAASASSIEAITKLGGNFDKVPQLGRPSKKTTEDK